MKDLRDELESERIIAEAVIRVVNAPSSSHYQEEVECNIACTQANCDDFKTYENSPTSVPSIPLSERVKKHRYQQSSFVKMKHHPFVLPSATAVPSFPLKSFADYDATNMTLSDYSLFLSTMPPFPYSSAGKGGYSDDVTRKVTPAYDASSTNPSVFVIGFKPIVSPSYESFIKRCPIHPKNDSWNHDHDKYKDVSELDSETSSNIFILGADDGSTTKYSSSTTTITTASALPISCCYTPPPMIDTNISIIPSNPPKLRRMRFADERANVPSYQDAKKDMLFCDYMFLD